MRIKIPCPELTLPPRERRQRARAMARITEEQLPKSQKARREVQPGNRGAMGNPRRVRVLFKRAGKYPPHQNYRECARRQRQMGIRGADDSRR